MSRVSRHIKDANAGHWAPVRHDAAMSEDYTQIERINESMQTAIDAQEAGDFRTAVSKARTAWMLCASLPDSELADERLRWKPETIQPIVTELARLAQTQPRAGEGHGALFRGIEMNYRKG